ncbi:NAD-binding protein [Morganella psychrotolerans]|uniref:Potassium channel protein n=1 Tax=Morganella psychrotolerans TaxID=368603 RepID=A0A5M9R0A6_9GAMM|nr:NAD-binding protein [Morganella psychrotolerans]KAA8713921.1 potassium channel protein [Morganella psychrotolerans]OBU03326.1 potassium channel protein [Morganella psychrotolerans]
MLINKLMAGVRGLLNLRVILSLLLLADGVMILSPVLFSYTGDIAWKDGGFTAWLQSLGFMKLLDIPRFMMGLLLVLLSLLMLTGARIAWLFSLFILLIMALMDLGLAREYSGQGYFSLALLIANGCLWRKFPLHSLTSAGVVAISSIILLVVYSVFGTLYLGNEFQPHVTDISSAFYFALVCMTTVGFGDIIPISTEARMFTLTVVVFGITIFTTSIVYIVGVVLRGTREIVKKRLLHMKEHYVVIGANPLAVNLYKGLKKRGLEAVVICTADQKANFPDGTIAVIGDGADAATLGSANVKDARCVMAVSDSDADNTFTLLAVKQLAGEGVKTVTIVNQEENRGKMRLLHADMSFSLSQLGSEVLMKMLCGENIDNNVMADILLAKTP